MKIARFVVCCLFISLFAVVGYSMHSSGDLKKGKQKQEEKKQEEKKKEQQGQDAVDVNVGIMQALAKTYQKKPGYVNVLFEGYTEKNGVTWYLFFLAIVAGIFVSFTAYVYPMIPIAVGILQSQVLHSIARNLLVTTCYVIGISFMYAALGYFSTITGLIFGRWMENDWLILLLVFLLVYFAFSMFGFYQVCKPSFLCRRNDVIKKCSLFKIFLLGLITGIVASLCLHPDYAWLLAFVARLSSSVLGFFILLGFSVGMWSSLIIVGTLFNIVVEFSRRGGWLLDIRRFIGFMLLAAAVYFLHPILFDYFISDANIISIFLYSAIAFAVGVSFVLQMSRSKLVFLFGLLLALGAIAVAGFYFYIRFIL